MSQDSGRFLNSIDDNVNRFDLKNQCSISSNECLYVRRRRRQGEAFIQRTDWMLGI